MSANPRYEREMELAAHMIAERFEQPALGEFFMACRQAAGHDVSAREADRLGDLYAAGMKALLSDENLVRIFGEDALHKILFNVGASLTRGKQPFGSFRMRELPSVRGRVVWTLQDAADVAAMREAIKPGSIWIRMDDVDSKAWPAVYATAQVQRRWLHKPFGVPGRRRGHSASTERRLMAVKEFLATHSPASDRQVWEALRSRGLETEEWADPNDEGALQRHRGKIGRLRREIRENSRRGNR